MHGRARNVDRWPPEPYRRNWRSPRGSRLRRAVRRSEACHRPTQASTQGEHARVRARDAREHPDRGEGGPDRWEVEVLERAHGERLRVALTGGKGRRTSVTRFRVRRRCLNHDGRCAQGRTTRLLCGSPAKHLESCTCGNEACGPPAATGPSTLRYRTLRLFRMRTFSTGSSTTAPSSVTDTTVASWMSPCTLYPWGTRALVDETTASRWSAGALWAVHRRGDEIELLAS